MGALMKNKPPGEGSAMGAGPSSMTGMFKTPEMVEEMPSPALPSS